MKVSRNLHRALQGSHHIDAPFAVLRQEVDLPCKLLEKIHPGCRVLENKLHFKLKKAGPPFGGPPDDWREKSLPGRKVLEDVPNLRELAADVEGDVEKALRKALRKELHRHADNTGESLAGHH